MSLEDELANLRSSYRRLQPGQRIRIARNRIREPLTGSAELVTCVSAIEGTLRSLVTWQEANEIPSEKVYEAYRRSKFSTLLETYLMQTNAVLSDLTNDECHTRVSLAVCFRNLIVHECTYLGQDKYPSLIEACMTFMDSLEQHASQRWRIT